MLEDGQFDWILQLTDTVGLAAFTIIGAKVAILSERHWFWIQICGVISRAGGGVLMDIRGGREPRTFRGEMDEEIAVLGGLMLTGLLMLASRAEPVETFIVFAICLTVGVVYLLRVGIVSRGVRSPGIA
jgi:uncharacterized membrane protein YeiH